jgi:hypothetical protein
MLDFENHLLSSISSFILKLERQEEIELTQVQRIQTPDGELHLRRKIRMNENSTLKRCLVGKLKILAAQSLPSGVVFAKVCDHSVVVGNHYDDGVLGIFIPEGAIVPDKLAEEMWIKGKLAGKKKNRVKSRKIGGSVSEGLFYGSRFFIMKGEEKEYFGGESWNLDWIEGQDVTEEIGVKFHEE